MLITSRHNPRVKQTAALRRSSARRAARRFLVDGGRDIARAAGAGLEILDLFTCPAWLDEQDQECLARWRGAPSSPCWETTPKVMERLAYGQRRAGLVAVVRQPDPLSLTSLPLPSWPIVVVLDQAEKPGNIGAVMRSSEAAGAAALILVDAATDRFNPNTIRSSAGAVFTLCTVEATLQEVLAWLRQPPAPVLAAWVRPESGDYAACDFRAGAVLVLGAEDRGLRDAWAAAATPITIPMCAGSQDSLNLSNAAAVLLFEAARQRRLVN